MALRPSTKEIGDDGWRRSFICAVYLTIREFLSDESVTLQNWIQFAIKHVGIVVRESYLTALGWGLVQLGDGTHKIERTAALRLQSYFQATNGLVLFMNCLNNGLPVTNALPIIKKLSDLTIDVICVNTELGAAAKPTNRIEGFRQPAKSHPHFAMSTLFPVPAAHPLITHGVTVCHFPELLGFPVAEMDGIFQGEGIGGISSQANIGNHCFVMSMGNDTHGKYNSAIMEFRF
ncbi:mating-type protein MAT alpha 1-domain-containing protein [Achaetomium macrosporum]|uniref:Mating-type protein MAT alpha 1-domain-containing protein n=1 Tax=Achaetomium macrosporum TaxID=79813 RepID=A0AAN7H3L6_9PEZI|nr:mating-type protein MAT alpha 1-domain-containing protein [Achaetomium macrosporum]